ncbi:MAG: hydroxyacid dehydrogenase [Gluconacetobacter diazotrophicus]|nr:hydroxyacid dehydrogenase [Gluconacetobacter diazotrophicus]
MSFAKPAILLDPYPRRIADIFRPGTLAALREQAVLHEHDDGTGPMPAARAERLLPEVTLVLGQTDLPAERVARAERLRGVINLETNFGPNVDYGACFARGIHVLTPGSAFAPAVAETALGMAIDLARGISAADRDFRAGCERWGLDGNAGCFSLRGAAVGIIGYGDLGRALHALLEPFGCRVAVHDPWLPDLLVRRAGAEPRDLDALLRSSRVVFVFAGATSENEGFLDGRRLKLIPDGAVLLLMSRAAVVDFPAMLGEAASGRLRVGTDVFPAEPVAAGDPMRGNVGMLFSAHRAGAMEEALLDIGEQAAADAMLMLRGLPPAMCRRAQPETVGMSRSRPIEKS